MSMFSWASEELCSCSLDLVTQATCAVLCAYSGLENIIQERKSGYKSPYVSEFGFYL